MVCADRMLLDADHWSSAKEVMKSGLRWDAATCHRNVSRQNDKITMTIGANDKFHTTD